MIPNEIITLVMHIRRNKKIKFIYILLSTVVFINCGKEININEFPKEDFEQVFAYKMTGENGEVIENDKISNKVVGKGELLTEQEIEELTKIFYDKSTYGETVSKCFEPQIGYVFYGNKNKIVAHSTICLACNWMKTSPDIGVFIFSAKEGVDWKN